MTRSEPTRYEIERAMQAVIGCKSGYREQLVDKTDILNTILTVLRAELARQDAKPLTCDGCGHNGRWDYSIEYGYPCPCLGCKRIAPDRYEPKGEKA